MRVLLDELREWNHRLAARAFDVRELVFEEPATPSEVESLESKVGLALPPSFRDALTRISKHVEFRWFAPDGTEFPEPFANCFSGDLHWSLDFTAQFNESKE